MKEFLFDKTAIWFISGMVDSPWKKIRITNDGDDDDFLNDWNIDLWNYVLLIENTVCFFVVGNIFFIWKWEKNSDAFCYVLLNDDDISFSFNNLKRSEKKIRRYKNNVPRSKHGLIDSRYMWQLNNHRPKK